MHRDFSFSLQPAIKLVQEGQPAFSRTSSGQGPEPDFGVVLSQGRRGHLADQTVDADAPGLCQATQTSVLALGNPNCQCAHRNSRPEDSTLGRGGRMASCAPIANIANRRKISLDKDFGMC
jgi:hypothetical protein